MLMKPGSVARMSPQAIVLASYSHHAETNLDAVKQALDQNLNIITQIKHFNLNAGDLLWHILTDDRNLVYVLISSSNYPLHSARICLEDLRRTFTCKMGPHLATAKENSLSKACRDMLQTLCYQYDNLPEDEKLASLSSKVNSVKLVMQSNVDAALQNCVKLESIEAQAESLRQTSTTGLLQASRFTQNRLWWYQLKMRALIALVVLAALCIVIAIAVAVSSK